MSRVKTLILKKESVYLFGAFLILFAVSTLAPLIKQQAVTGTIVNATLFITTVILGTQSAVFVAILPSVISLAIGFLPSPLAPMVPFIITSNIILVFVFGELKKVNYWIGAVVASLLKFLFLFSTSSIVVNLILKEDLARKVALMMSWPQLFTALGGGAVAFLIFKIFKKYNGG
ncbi:MAG: ECF transporter S component [Patescibacteria group bacterium]